MDEEELIRRRMERTRERLTQKVESLEKRLTGSVEEGVAAVTNAVDIQAQFERHPWLMLGGSLLGGYLLATVLAGKSKKQPAELTTPAQPGADVPQGNGKPTASGDAAPNENVLSAYEPEINHLKRLALGVALGTIREALASQAPPEMGEHLRAILDDVTKKAGGEVLPRSDWENEPSPFPPPEEDQNGAAGGLDLDKPRW